MKNHPTGRKNTPQTSASTSAVDTQIAARLASKKNHLDLLKTALEENGCWKPKYANLSLDTLLGKVGVPWNVFEDNANRNEAGAISRISELFKKRRENKSFISLIFNPTAPAPTSKK
jgi:hypothetical protein